MAYPQIRAEVCRRIQLVERPESADLVVVAHSKDLDSHATQLARLSPSQRLALLSEEPFWDTVWGYGPLARDLQHPTKHGTLRVAQLNHQTSAIFQFRQIPYFLLTDTHYTTRYGVWFSEMAHYRPADWAEHFKAVNGRTAFVMAHRQSPRYDVAFAGTEVQSLCNQRTAVAEACRGNDVMYLGQRWQDGPPRQTITDWHLDKYLRLKNRFHFVSAIENTHQHQYITEKIFDAWAVGAVPLYMAGPKHRVHQLALPGTWLNLMDIQPEDVPAHLAAHVQTPEFLEAYTAQQKIIARLVGTSETWRAELERLGQALVHEFSQLLAG
ncbi:glycosyltransferase family 10 domain-containing protein [Pseudoprimorskyibacter insulae]|uniref:glycosyltransferase family 10 domain-containing protein n=1 Tax=Pseudoprimorskyibacter insulae TaxID=1695997 RepID=UPI0015E85B4E|nr:glycosyltransferase family 10 [Pseudoprimorskyibacter insulae]